MYSMQYSFSTRGEDNIQALRELRDKLSRYKGHSLVDVYRAFNLASITAPARDDVMSDVGVVNVTSAESTYAAFIITTQTIASPHAELWATICKSLSPRVRVDMLGSGPEYKRFCKPVFVPEQLRFDYERI